MVMQFWKLFQKTHPYSIHPKILVALPWFINMIQLQRMLQYKCYCISFMSNLEREISKFRKVQHRRWRSLMGQRHKNLQELWSVQQLDVTSTQLYNNRNQIYFWWWRLLNLQSEIFSYMMSCSHIKNWKQLQTPHSSSCKICEIMWELELKNYALGALYIYNWDNVVIIVLVIM